jgi:hypothetical protein
VFASTSTTQTITGLPNSATYRFRVQAINAVGASGYSTVTNPVTPRGLHTLYLNLESVGTAGGGTLLSSDPALPAVVCSVPAGSRQQCQHAVQGGDELVLQAVLDDPDDDIQWWGCDSVFGDDDDKCLVFVREENLSVDVFLFVP